MNLHDDHFHDFIMSAFLIFCGVALLIAGLSVPPHGEIHPSVLTAFGEILCFVGAIKGIDYKKKKND